MEKRRGPQTDGDTDAATFKHKHQGTEMLTILNTACFMDSCQMQQESCT